MLETSKKLKTYSIFFLKTVIHGRCSRELTATCHSCISTPMTLFARTFSGIVSHHALAGSLRLGSKGSPAATQWTLRKEVSAQQGLSSLPLRALVIACSLHSGGEGGPLKQPTSCMCSSSVCAHGSAWCREPTHRPSPRDWPGLLYVFAIWYHKHRSRKSS